MAEIANKYSENVPGKYYVDNQCIDCDLCCETAPDNFTRNEDGGYSYVCKQPTTSEEESLCKAAMKGCPVEAIGNDGTRDILFRHHATGETTVVDYNEFKGRILNGELSPHD